MSKNKIVGVYRIRNEEKWIGKSIDSIKEICDDIIILDDDSTDNTVEICSSFEHVTVHQQTNLPFDEARDRNFLLQKALAKNPDMILAMDGDEILMKGASNILFEEIDILYTNSNVFEFQFLTLWDKPDQIRCDGIFGNYWVKRLYRLKNQPENLSIGKTDSPGNVHAFSIPSNLIGFDSPVRSNVKFLHMASISQEERQRKFDFYTNMDPNNNLTDGYRHLISGEGIFSGPNGIELQKLPEKLTITI